MTTTPLRRSPLDHLIAAFPSEKGPLLMADWSWLTGGDKLPILLTASGNAFLRDATGAVYELDTSEGWVRRVFESVNDFRGALADADFIAEHLHAQLVAELRARGIYLHAGQVYSFQVPPILGGACGLTNIQPMDMDVHFSTCGQVFRQVRELDELGLPSGSVG